MARCISNKFLADLTTGVLKEVLNIIKQDDTLMLELRGNRVSIYYRGGLLFEIENKQDAYIFKNGDDKYYAGHNYELPTISFPNNDLCDTNKLKDYIARFKYIIDNYFGGIRCESTNRTRFSIENELRQHLVRENNYTISANQTDYFIIDTEYQTPDKKKFDIVAIEWISESGKRKLQGGYKPKLVIFELKYGDKAISGKCGLASHLKDFNTFIKDTKRKESFKEEMLKLLQQKRFLGLIPYLSKSNNNEVKEFDDEVDFVFLLANYYSKSSNLRNEIDEIENKGGTFKMIAANYLGYGLFKDKMLDIANPEHRKLILCD